MKGRKTGGRVKGSQNKVTKNARELISKFLDEKWPTIELSFNNLSDRDKVHYYERLLQYVLPKYQNLGFDISNFSEQDLEQLIKRLKEQV